MHFEQFVQNPFTGKKVKVGSSTWRAMLRDETLPGWNK